MVKSSLHRLPSHEVTQTGFSLLAPTPTLLLLKIHSADYLRE